MKIKMPKIDYIVSDKDILEIDCGKNKSFYELTDMLKEQKFDFNEKFSFCVWTNEKCTNLTGCFCICDEEMRVSQTYKYKTKEDLQIAYASCLKELEKLYYDWLDNLLEEY